MSLKQISVAFVSQKVCLNITAEREIYETVNENVIRVLGLHLIKFLDRQILWFLFCMHVTKTWNSTRELDLIN